MSVRVLASADPRNLDRDPRFLALTRHIHLFATRTMQRGWEQRHLPGIPVEKIQRGRDNDWRLMRPGVKLCTAHSAKGLEFDHVIIYRVNEGILPRKPPEELDEPAEAEFYMSARRLLYVAMTRARLSLRITSSRPPSRFVEEMPAELILEAPQVQRS
jgi:superfamily I DNA/RNA helicase